MSARTELHKQRLKQATKSKPYRIMNDSRIRPAHRLGVWANPARIFSMPPKQGIIHFT